MRTLLAPLLLVAACGDNLAPCPDDVGGSCELPTCAELGCEVGLCNRAGECTCVPPGDDLPVACRAAFGGAL